jgi:hypothetical protein
MEREALRHAQDQAREEARQQILQAKIDRAFRREQERTTSKIDWQENGGRRLRAFLYWAFVLLLSIPFVGIPLVLALGWHFWKKRRTA